MSLNKEKLFFLGSVLAQFAVLGWLIFSYQSIVLGGTEVILKTQPVDPRDILRGQYVALRYDISTLDVKLFYSDTNNLKSGRSVYVELEKTGGNIWQATGATLNKPVEGKFIKGTVENISGSRVNIKYGIESYFANPEKAQELEREARRGALLMRVVIDDEGNAIVRGVFDGGGATLLPGGAQARSRDARRLADAAQLRVAMEIYFDMNGSYPENLQDLMPQTIPSLPQDSLTGANYYYYLCGPNSYHIGADLEDQANSALGSDKDIASLCPGDKVNGSDNLSCDGRTPGRFCYDIAEGEPTTVPASALPPKITVTNPNNAQIFTINQMISIRWNAQGVPQGGKFEVSFSDEVTKKIVTSAVLESGARSYDAFAALGVFTPNRFYRAKVSLKHANGKVVASDESDKAFAISQ